MKQKDFVLDPCADRATQSAGALAAITKCYSGRHTMQTALESSHALVTAGAIFSVTRYEVQLVLDRSARIAATQFTFNFNRFRDAEAFGQFRFCGEDITRLVPILSWPVGQSHTSSSRYAVSPILATCSLLRRMAVPERWEDLCTMFGKHPSQVSEIF